jgi:hypothetical protein
MTAQSGLVLLRPLAGSYSAVDMSKNLETWPHSPGRSLDRTEDPAQSWPGLTHGYKASRRGRMASNLKPVLDLDGFLPARVGAGRLARLEAVDSLS